MGGHYKPERGTPKKCRPSALPKGKRVAKGKGVVKMSYKRKSLTPSCCSRKRRIAREKVKSCKRLKLENEATEVKSNISDDESLGLEITGVKEGVKKIPKPIVCPTSEFLNRASSSSRVMVLCVMIWSRSSKKRHWYFCWKLVVKV